MNVADVQSNNKRIARNTLLLYCRTLLIMLITLYTSRVILNALGVIDYGIYNVVGGIVMMLGFLNGAMTTTTQRYLTFELGNKNYKQLKLVFNTSQLIFGVISVFIIIFSETIGLWFLYNKMQIPAERIVASFWVFQSSVLTSVITIMSVPYNAIIIAHEKMNVFAYISILEGSLKLGIAYTLLLFSGDKLILYSILMVVVQFTIRITYNIYCTKNFPETIFKYQVNKSLIKEMTTFTSWNLFGNIASITYSQGTNIILNMFFGPTVNAARAISVQVQQAIIQFTNSFQMALNPQITKYYAIGEYTNMHKLINRSSKFTLMLLLFLSLPIFLNTNFILTFWLKSVPDYTIVFLRIILCSTILDAMANPLMIAASATGKVKIYQSTIGTILLCILPLSYIALKLGGEPQSVFIIHLGIVSIAFITRLFIVRALVHISLLDYWKNTIIKCFFIIILSIPIPLLVKSYLDEGVHSFFIVSILSITTVSFSSYYLGLTISEKKFVNNKMSEIAKRIIFNK